MTTEIARKVTCACGTSLKESYPAAIRRHTETAKHQAWIVAQYGSLAGAPENLLEVDEHIAQSDAEWLDELSAKPESIATCDICGDTSDHKHEELAAEGPAQEIGETATAYLARLEELLSASAYSSFIGTDEGQKLLSDAQTEDKESRKATRKAERGLHIDPATGATVLTPGVPVVSPLRAKKPKETRVIEVAGVVIHPESGKMVNKSLAIGTTPVEIDGVKYLPVLDRHGNPQVRYAKDSYAWKCSDCGRRLRASECTGDSPTSHAPVQHPFGYRPEDRIVK